MSGERVLVLAPTFHRYGEAIGAALTLLGHETRVCAYDAPPSTVTAVGTKLTIELPLRLGVSSARDRHRRQCTRRAMEALETFRPDLVLIVRGDLLGDALWETLATRRVPTVAWMYDELHRMDHTLDHLRSVRAVASYSDQDTTTLRTMGIDAHFVPLAFDSLTGFTARPSTEITFIGAAYPGRIAILTELHSRGLDVRAYGRDWSHAPIDRARSWRWQRPDVPWGRDVDRATAFGIMGGAAATLNLHGDQTGLTMRTFEACGTGGFQIVDRPDVAPFFEPDVEVTVFGSADELAALCRRSTIDRHWRDSIAAAGRRRTQAEHTMVHRARTLRELWA